MDIRYVLSCLWVLSVCTHPVLAQKKPPKDRNVILLEEIEKSAARSPYDVVRKLRPVWLSNHGVSGLLDGSGQPVTKQTAMAVYVDGVRRGGLDELRFMPLELVREIRHLPADEAVVRYGSDLPFGAIEIITKK